LSSRSTAECYASLPIIDFEETDSKVVVDSIMETINNMYVVSVARRKVTADPGRKRIHREEYYAFSGKEIVAIERSLEDTVILAIERAMKKYSKDIITIFRGKNVQPEQIDAIIETVREQGIYAEIFAVDSPNNLSELTISFE
jgi:dihydroxyacetone kinase-like predicted kinase